MHWLRKVQVWHTGELQDMYERIMRATLNLLAMHFPWSAANWKKYQPCCTKVISPDRLLEEVTVNCCAGRRADDDLVH